MEVGVWLRNGLDVLAFPAISISFIAAFLILVQKKNRNRYPHTFIGYICLAQCSNIYALNNFSSNYCEERPLLYNLLVLKDSWLSN